MTDTTATDSEGEAKKHAKEPTVIQDQGFFQHETGDTYNGFFEVKKKDRLAKMHGPGVYTTAEGDVYSGTWEMDKPSAREEVNITFTDTSRFEGYLKDWSFFGKGKYCYPDGSLLECDFVENCPVGPLTLIDPNGHIWLGKAERGFGWFEPVNHFYDMLEKTREPRKVKPRHKSKDVPEEPVVIPKIVKIKAKVHR